MAAKVHTAARVREMTFATQGFLFVVIAQAYRAQAYNMRPGEGELTWMTAVHLAIMFSPFILARITPLMGVLPQLFLRDGARIELHDAGLVYHFNNVKRPLFASWDHVESLRRTRFGLVLHIRPDPSLTQGMTRFQGEFWDRKLRRPIRLQYVSAFAPERGLWQCLAAARRAGVTVDGFETAPKDMPKATGATVGKS
ncbi:MAG: hypothetical protein AAGE76_09045 [Pseudomonadota bacterium]